MSLVPVQRAAPSTNYRRPARAVSPWAAVWLACFGMTAPLLAQNPVHYRYDSAPAPGAIGGEQLRRGGPLPGFFQPVEIGAPQGALISLAEADVFAPPEPAPLKVGLLIAPVYRLRVTQIPLNEGREVYPTIEIVDRLYSPTELAHKFPIQIELTREDLEEALAGKFVTRVIYLEDPSRALPYPQRPDGHQNWFDVGPGANPLYIADTMGRPVAVLRIGGRQPVDVAAPDAGFLYGCPPLVRYHQVEIEEVIDSPQVRSAPIATAIAAEEAPSKTRRWFRNVGLPKR